MSCVNERSGWSRRPASRSLGCRCTRPVQRIAPRVGIVPDVGERIRPGRVAIHPGLLGGVGGRGGFGVA